MDVYLKNISLEYKELNRSHNLDTVEDMPFGLDNRLFNFIFAVPNSNAFCNKMKSPDTFYGSNLLQMIQEGSHAAFTELYDYYWEELYDNAYKRLRRDDVCKDIIQDIFIDVWNRRESLQIENLSAYLHTAVRFQVLNYFSKNKISTHFVEPFENIEDYSLVTDAVINKKEQDSLIEAWAKTLPKKRQNIFLLNQIDQLTPKEISIKLNLSQKTVHNQLGSARQSLRTKFAHLFPILFVLILFK